MSLHYRVRRGDDARHAYRAHHRRVWPKLTVVAHTGSHLIVGAVTGTGPSQDSPAFTPAMCQAAQLLHLDTVLAYEVVRTARAAALDRKCQKRRGERRTCLAVTPHRSIRHSGVTPALTL